MPLHLLPVVASCRSRPPMPGTSNDKRLLRLSAARGDCRLLPLPRHGDRSDSCHHAMPVAFLPHYAACHTWRLLQSPRRCRAPWRPSGPAAAHAPVVMFLLTPAAAIPWRPLRPPLLPRLWRPLHCHAAPRGDCYGPRRCRLVTTPAPAATTADATNNVVPFALPAQSNGVKTPAGNDGPSRKQGTFRLLTPRSSAQLPLILLQQDYGGH